MKFQRVLSSPSALNFVKSLGAIISQIKDVKKDYAKI